MVAVGLLTKPALESLGIIFEDYEHRLDPDYDSAFPNVPFSNKPSANDPAYRNELQSVLNPNILPLSFANAFKRGLTRLGIPITAIGVWETVGTTHVSC